jgi:hypothetical protein
METQRGGTVSNPTSSEAAELIARSERLAAQVRTSSSARFTAWLVGVAAATPLYFVCLAVTGDDVAGTVASSVVFAAILLSLSVSLLPGVLVASRGFAARFGIAVGVWGGVVGLAVGLGLALFPGALWFWIPAGAIAAAPLAIGARAEARA